MPTSTRDLAVAVPAERGDAARQLVVVLAGEDRVDDERLEPGVPQPAGLGGAGVDVGRGERDLARVQQDRLAQVARRRP